MKRKIVLRPRQVDEVTPRDIESADEVLVLNVGGYITPSMMRDIWHAIRCGKVLRWLEPQYADQNLMEAREAEHLRRHEEGLLD